MIKPLLWPKIRRFYRRKPGTGKTIFCLIAGLWMALAPEAAAFDGRYRDWQLVLDRHVKEDRLDYRSLWASRRPLRDFLRDVSKLPRETYEAWDEKKKIAFWLNVYNAAAVQIVLYHYPIGRSYRPKTVLYPANSIQQIPDVWKREFVLVFGKKMSLDEIEHGVLRQDFVEPRIHFGLVCASIGCPPLKSEVYRGESLDRQLDEQTRRYLSTPQGARYEPETDTLYLSSIFKWFAEDFELGDGLIPFLKKYLPEPAAQKLSGKTRLDTLSYDWSLNDRDVEDVS